MLTASQIIKIYELVRTYCQDDKKAQAVTDEIVQLYNTRPKQK